MDANNPRAFDNPRAFPRPLPTGKYPPDEAAQVARIYAGMTLRDYFAAAALTGLVAMPSTDPDLDVQQAAGAAYGLADAMLAQRGKP